MPRCVRTSLQLILWCALGAGCLPTSGGTGIGPPTYPAQTPATPLGISIVQVYPGDPNLRINPSQVNPGSPNAFVQLANESSNVLSFSKNPLSLLGPNNHRIDLSTLPDLSPQGRVIVDATALDLHWAAGELALTDSRFNAQAYLAWGNAPGLFGPTMLLSQAASLATAESAVAVSVSLFNAANLAIASDPNVQDANHRVVGCITPDENRAAGAAAPTACPADSTTPLLQLAELSPPAGPDESWVEVLNLSSGPIDLYGCLLCYQDACYMIDTSVIIANPLAAEDATHPARAILYLGSSNDDHTGATQVDLPNLPPLRSIDELVLLPPGGAKSLTTLNTAWSYVRYSNDPESGPATAFFSQLPAGLWDTATHFVQGPRLSADSVALSPGANPMFSGWNPAQRTEGLPNVAFDPANLATWTACSYVPSPEADPNIGTSAVDLASQLVTVKNLSASPIALTGYQLANPKAPSLWAQPPSLAAIRSSSSCTPTQCRAAIPRACAGTTRHSALTS